MAFEIDHEAVSADNIFMLSDEKLSSLGVVAAASQGRDRLDEAGMAVGSCSRDDHPDDGREEIVSHVVSLR